MPVVKKMTMAPKPKVTPKPKPKVTPKAPAKKINPEKLLQEYLKKGMSLDKARNKVANQTGTWPNGYTN